MLDQLFKKLPVSSHARSESSPHLRHSITNSFFPSGSTLADNVFTNDLPVAPSPRGQERARGQLHRSFDATILTEPSNVLQSDLASARPLTRDLPPLFTTPSNLSPTKRQNCEPDTDIHDFAYSPTRSAHPSPTRSKRLSTSLFTVDHTELVRKEPSSNKLAGWFQGESTPINLSVFPSPTKEKPDALATMPPAMKAMPLTPKPGLASRFSFFTTKPSPTRPSTDQDQDDEFLNLDISTALFPAGPADPFSPSSFKNLAQNAEGLTSRLQAAYRDRTMSLRDMRAEKETVAEELEGAETRSRHLKIQLDDLSARVVEQDKAMMELVDELANLKRIRAEEEDARKRTIRPVQPSISNPAAEQQDTSARRSRRDRLSSTSSATDYESDTESLFSKNQNPSPRISLSSVETTGSPEAYHHPDLAFTAVSSPPFQSARRPTPRKSQRSKEESCVWSCANCQGGGAAEAWGVVGMLKEENRCLKERVEQVEGALEGCLDVVARLE
ncbi:MAG: hypothetical protein Q9195_009143 [Heterodermia aff. obscurata]